jgi:hypothetical protein
MADFLTEKRQEIDNRLKELRPLYDEYLKLEKAQAALAGMDQGQRRGPGRPRGSSSGSSKSASGNGRRRRGRSGGSWADRALEVVRQNPGVTVTEVGDQLGMTQKNYLYRVMNNLVDDGAVRKEGRGFHAA